MRHARSRLSFALYVCVFFVWNLHMLHELVHKLKKYATHVLLTLHTIFFKIFFNHKIIISMDDALWLRAERILKQDKMRKKLLLSSFLSIHIRWWG